MANCRKIFSKKKGKKSSTTTHTTTSNFISTHFKHHLRLLDQLILTLFQYAIFGIVKVLLLPSLSYNIISQTPVNNMVIDSVTTRQVAGILPLTARCVPTRHGPDDPSS